jgi:MoCo/4Fe-4S cofactor protein with predicted Tat translocation signal
VEHSPFDQLFDMSSMSTASSTNSQASPYWRSLAQLENSPEFEQFLHREFPVGASEYPSGVSRRRWLQLMGASFLLAGFTGCRRWDAEDLAPFAVRPENRIPGKPVHYATTLPIAGRSEHLLVTSHDGRPIKIEGNPEHPGSRGSSSLFAQAALLELYDPDRSASVRQRVGKETFSRNWGEFDQFAAGHFAELRQRRGAGLAVLFEPTPSLSFSDLLQRLRQAFPEVRFYEYAPLSDDNSVEGARLAFGEPCRAHLQLDAARVIVTLDADLFHEHPAALVHARDFVAGRDPASGKMSRLYALESQFSLTGAAADHRWPVPSHQIPLHLDYLEQLLRRGAAGEDLQPAPAADSPLDAQQQHTAPGSGQ